MVNLTKKFNIKKIASGTTLQTGKMLIFIIPVIGFLLAITQFFFNRSLWLDEAMLAINIVTIDAIDLLKPLKFDQVAPILFLQAEKLFSQIIPDSELGLRIFPLICYLVALVFVFKIIRLQFQNINVQIVTLSFFVFNSTLIYYSNEVKQYMTDVMVLSVVNYLILKNYEKPATKYFLLAITGVLALFLSNVAVIVLLSAGALWFFQEFRRTPVTAFAGVFGAWILSFAVYYFFFIHDHPAKYVMLDYWKGANAFMPLNPANPDFFWFFFEKTQIVLGILSNSKSILVGSFFGLLVFVGFINLIFIRKNKSFIALLILPLVVHLLLSSFQIYPFDKRLILYMVPNFVIVLGYFFDFLTKYFSTKLTTNKLKFLTLVFSVIIAILFFIKEFPIEKEELKKSMNFISSNISPDDNIYVYYGASNAFHYYTLSNYYQPENNLIVGTSFKKNKTSYLDEISLLRGQTWLLFSHNVDNEEEYIINQLESKGNLRIKSFQAKGSSAYLFDLKN